jgi:hypothetical protein
MGSGRLASFFPQKLVLSLASPTDAIALGIPRDEAGKLGVPGRALWSAQGETVICHVAIYD